jgi:hypothetical protein
MDWEEHKKLGKKAVKLHAKMVRRDTHNDPVKCFKARFSMHGSISG